MSDRFSGGRSSATPDARTLRARGNSPLQDTESQLPSRKTPAHFPTVESGFRSVIIFLTVCTHQRKPLLANAEAAQLIINAWRVADFWCVGRYRHHAGSHSFILRTEHFSAAAAEELDRVLEESCDPTMAEPNAGSHLAARVLGPAIAAWRFLWGEVGIRGKQSRASRLCRPRARLALPRRTERAGVARRLIGGRSSATPANARVRGARPSISHATNTPLQ
jgi:hypothetical protein